MCLFNFLIFGLLIPFFFFKSLSVDTIESVMWGSSFSLGYHKHPPLCAWITYLCTLFSLKGAYIFSQLQVFLYLFGIFKVVDFLRGKEHAYASVSLCLISFMTNVFVSKSNPETLEWALTPLFFYNFLKVLKENKNHAAVGLLAGILILSKYSSAGILLVCGFFLLKDRFNKKIWISIIVFLIVIAPHIFWLIENNFSTFTYTSNRFSKPFQLHQLLYFTIIPFACYIFPIIVTFILGGRLSFKDIGVFFLLPYISVILFSFFTKSHIRGHWAYPMSSLIPLFLVFKNVPVNLHKICRNILFFIAFAVSVFHVLVLLNFIHAPTSRCFFDPYFMKHEIEARGIVPKKVIGHTLLKGHLEYIFKKEGNCHLIITDSKEEFNSYLITYKDAKVLECIKAPKDTSEYVNFYLAVLNN